MIFEICLPFTWDSRYGRMPSLIVALRARGELKLYFQALEVFRKTNDYDLDAESIELFKTMPETLISTIRKLTIT
jgi:hypothetical protein